VAFEERQYQINNFELKKSKDQDVEQDEVLQEKINQQIDLEFSAQEQMLISKIF